MYIKPYVQGIDELTEQEEFDKLISKEDCVIDYTPSTYISKIKACSHTKLSDYNTPKEVYNSIQNEYENKKPIIDIIV